MQVHTRSESDIYPTATGRMLMASLPAKELDNLIQVLGLPQPHILAEIHSKEDLLAALHEIRKNEIALTLSAKHTDKISGSYPKSYPDDSFPKHIFTREPVYLFPQRSHSKRVAQYRTTD